MPHTTICVADAAEPSYSEKPFDTADMHGTNSHTAIGRSTSAQHIRTEPAIIPRRPGMPLSVAPLARQSCHVYPAAPKDHTSTASVSRDGEGIYRIGSGAGD